MSKITTVSKRNGLTQPFDAQKITQAVYKGMKAVGHDNITDANSVAWLTIRKLEAKAEENNLVVFIPTVEQIQDTVEEALMESNFHSVAKSYILYRNERTKERRRNIFKKRVNLKPYEYPELLPYVDAIRHSYWIHTEFNFTSDVQHFKVNINDVERNAIKNTMLAIAQIEVAVKSFRGDIYKKFPKAEVGAVGATFAESEVRHQDAYSHLLEILGLNTDFEKIKEIPAMIKRVNYLEKALQNSKSADDKEYAKTLLLFSLFIEHVSLFSQFLIMMAFNKHKNVFKGISNVVEATSKEEQIHGMFGIDLIKIIKEENPHWFDAEHNKAIQDSCQGAFDAECEVIDRIFEAGELDFLSANTVKEFIKQRFNNSLTSIGIDAIFEVDEAELIKTERFDDEVIATKHGDFFVKRSINYNKRSKSVTSNDLF